MLAKCSVELSDLSKFKSELMGIGIIMVMLLHFKVPIFNYIGFVGVDIFILLSGLGCYYSFARNSKISDFYKKRIVRIAPCYLLITFITRYFLMEDSIKTALWRCTTIGFWTNSPFHEWYVPSVLLFYLMLPVLYWLINIKITPPLYV